MSLKKPRRQISLAKARDYVKAWSASGLSQTAFCMKMGFSESSIYRWMQRIKQADAKAALPEDVRTAGELKPVEVINPESSNALPLIKQQVEICLPDNIKLRFPAIVNPQQISELLRELQSCN